MGSGQMPASSLGFHLLARLKNNKKKKNKAESFPLLFLACRVKTTQQKFSFPAETGRLILTFDIWQQKSFFSLSLSLFISFVIKIHCYYAEADKYSGFI